MYKYSKGINLVAGGEKHRVYVKKSPTGVGKGVKGHVMVNHPTEDKGKWDTIDLTEKAGAKTVEEGKAATKKWHAENPYISGAKSVKQYRGDENLPEAKKGMKKTYKYQDGNRAALIKSLEKKHLGDIYETERNKEGVNLPGRDYWEMKFRDQLNTSDAAKLYENIIKKQQLMGVKDRIYKSPNPLVSPDQRNNIETSMPPSNINPKTLNVDKKISDKESFGIDEGMYKKGSKSMKNCGCKHPKTKYKYGAGALTIPEGSAIVTANGGKNKQALMAYKQGNYKLLNKIIDDMPEDNVDRKKAGYKSAKGKYIYRRGAQSVTDPPPSKIYEKIYIDEEGNYFKVIPNSKAGSPFNRIRVDEKGNPYPSDKQFRGDDLSATFWADRVTPSRTRNAVNINNELTEEIVPFENKWASIMQSRYPELYKDLGSPVWVTQNADKSPNVIYKRGSETEEEALTRAGTEIEKDIEERYQKEKENSKRFLEIEESKNQKNQPIVKRKKYKYIKPLEGKTATLNIPKQELQTPKLKTFDYNQNNYNQLPDETQPNNNPAVVNPAVQGNTQETQQQNISPVPASTVNQNTGNTVTNTNVVQNQNSSTNNGTAANTQPVGVGQWTDTYDKLEKMLKHEKNKKLREELFKRYKAANPSANITEDQYIDNLLTAQKQNYAMQEKYGQDALNEENWDWVTGRNGVSSWKNKRYTDAMTDLRMTPLNEEQIKQFQQAYRDLEDAMNDPQFEQNFGKYFKTNPIGKSDQTYRGKPISDDDGIWGNTANRQFLQLSGYEDPVTTTTTGGNGITPIPPPQNPPDEEWEEVEGTKFKVPPVAMSLGETSAIANVIGKGIQSPRESYLKLDRYNYASQLPKTLREIQLAEQAGRESARDIVAGDAGRYLSQSGNLSAAKMKAANEAVIQDTLARQDILNKNVDLSNTELSTNRSLKDYYDDIKRQNINDFNALSIMGGQSIDESFDNYQKMRNENLIATQGLQLMADMSPNYTLIQNPDGTVRAVSRYRKKSPSITQSITDNRNKINTIGNVAAMGKVPSVSNYIPGVSKFPTNERRPMTEQEKKDKSYGRIEKMQNILPFLQVPGSKKNNGTKKAKTYKRK